MAETQTYEGGCHCGAVRYRAEADLSGVIECNCSHCSKKGFLLVFTPEADFEMLSGDDAQAAYKFNKGHIAHLFCTTCGVQSFARGTGPDGAVMAALNVRCLDGVDVSALTITQVDGASL